MRPGTPKLPVHTQNDMLPKDTVTERQWEVLLLVVGGFSNKEIAAKLETSEETIKRHISNIFDKVGVDTRLQLTLWYISETADKRYVQIRRELIEMTQDRDKWRDACSLGDNFVMGLKLK